MDCVLVCVCVEEEYRGERGRVTKKWGGGGWSQCPHDLLRRCPGEPRRSARRQKGVIQATCRESNETKGLFPPEAHTSFQGSTCRMLAPLAARCPAPRPTNGAG